MLKPQKRHPQILNTKKPKPIQITLAKKNGNLQSSTNYLENIGTQKNPRNSRGLSRALKQKNTINSNSRNMTLNSLQSTEQKLKKQPCPNYMLNQDAISKNIIPQIKHFSDQRTGKQLGDVTKTVYYSKIGQDAQNVYQIKIKNISTGQLIQDIQSPVQSNKVNGQYQNQSYLINGVKGKVIGIAKGFYRDNREISKESVIGPSVQNQNVVKKAYVQKESELVLKQTMCSSLINPFNIMSAGKLNQKLRSNSFIKEQVKVFLCEGNKLNELNMKQAGSSQINSRDIKADVFLNTLSEPCVQIVDQKTQNATKLKLQISLLQKRLESCVEQIDSIEKNNSTQKVVELQNQIHSIKEYNQIEKERLQKQINILQEMLQNKQITQKIIINSQSKETQTQHQKLQDSQIQLSNLQKNQQIIRLRSQVTQLNQRIQNRQENTYRYSTFSQRQTYQNLNDKCSQYQIEMLRKKYHTLEQILESKKKQIHNKDSIIQMFIRKEVFKLMQNKGNLADQQQKGQKLKSIICELFTQLQEKLDKVLFSEQNQL